jgi:NAD(P)-dependent dehydrogenase (short-subunit alcohol dehydrogenase family)
MTVNPFGHFYLTYLLFDNIIKSKEARIINVSSEMHYQATDDIFSHLELKQ